MVYNQHNIAKYSLQSMHQVIYFKQILYDKTEQISLITKT